MTQLENKVFDTIQKYNMIESGDRIVIGLSGGADSCTLFEVLYSFRQLLNIELVVAHLNHGIRGEEAIRDMKFSEEVALKHNVIFSSKSVSVPDYVSKHKISEEAAGRKLRYEFFDEVCKQYNCNKIAVAHNMNDKAETILLNIIRGSASNGFEGIKPVNGRIIRPLIETSRLSIEEYAEYKNLHYVTDSTNCENIYARNIIRNSVLPQLCKINTAATENIIRCSEIISSESEFLDEEIKKINIVSERDGKILIDRNLFFNQHISIKKRAVMYALLNVAGNTQNVSNKQICLLVDNVKTGKRFYFGNDVNAVITSDYIEFSRVPYLEISYAYTVNIPSVVNVIETDTSYKFEIVDKYAKSPDSLCISLDNVNGNIILRTKKNGDQFQPYGMKGKKKIKSFFIDNKIPAYDRSLYPILEADGDILAVLPLRISEKCKVTPESKKILMITKCGGTYDK